MKFFVISDIHGYYDQMIKALDDAGFDKTNPDHWLISCGDNFDRGEQPLEVLHYLLNLERKTLIKGNHEDLIISCCHRGYPDFHDCSNGTAGTIEKIGHININSFELACEVTQLSLSPLIVQMIDYFETKNYVFVHSFIPYWIEKWRLADSKEWKEARWGNPFKLCNQGFWKENKNNSRLCIYVW